MQDADIFDIQKRLNFSSEINKYLDMIKEELKKLNYNNLDKMMDIIYDYLMGQLYNKIFPFDPHDEDTKIFQKSVLLSWIQPNHFLKLEEEIDFGNFENDVLNYFKLLELDKSSRKKIINLNKIFNSIKILLKFNNKEVKTIENNDCYSLPLIKYIIIKSQSLRLYTNLQFMKLYIGNKKNQKEENHLKILADSCNIIPTIKYNDLNNVTKEEFLKRCKEATLKIY